ncbi:MAG: PhoU domain-containing protein [Planctomycetia bacterium]|nr:PhoU domain-containing protein [Planctomycetia bacterium]
MFYWLTKSSGRQVSGLNKIRKDFSNMLESARHEFIIATDTCLAGIDPENIRDDLLATDKQINKAERDIRKELLIHAAVSCEMRKKFPDFPECLAMMSIVKDAERLGDYSKNIFDLAVISPLEPEGDDRERMFILKNLIDKLFVSCRHVFDTEDIEAATQLIRESTWIARQCEQNVVRILQAQAGDPRGPYYVLLYRYMKRIASHLRNICSSIVQPVHKIDFTSKLTRDVRDEGDLLDMKGEMPE